MLFRAPSSLRKRIMISFVFLTALIALLFFAVIHFGSDLIERYVFKESLESEASWVSAALARGMEPILPQGRLFYNEMTVPETYRDQLPGYHEYELPTGEEWHLLVFDDNDRRHYLLQDGTAFENLEDYIHLFLAVAVLISLTAALWVGRRTASRIIQPITELAEAVSRGTTPYPHQSATDEIGVLARTFSQHDETLQRYLAREQCFVGDVSHELRTPLAVILGAAEVIERQASPALAASAERIRRVAQEMNAQLNAMLLLSRAPETLDAPASELTPIIGNAIAHCRPLLAGKPVRLVFEPAAEVAVTGSPELIGSVIHNLLRNACQYTEEGEIRITLSPTAIVITDTGPGLPPSIDPALFERFSHDSRKKGEGLGLSIAQRIAGHLGWTMTVQNGPAGCRFALHFHAPDNAGNIPPAATL